MVAAAQDYRRLEPTLGMLRFLRASVAYRDYRI